MRLRLLIILVALVVVIGFLPYLLHQASQPGVYTGSTVGTVLSWSDGPDIELNADSLQKLTSESEQTARQASGGAIVPVRIISMGHRQVAVSFTGMGSPSSELQARVVAYVQNRLAPMARDQAASK